MMFIVAEKVIGERMATYIPLFLKKKITQRKIETLEKIIEKNSIIINKQKNVILLETKGSAEWFNSTLFDKFVKKQKALFFLTTNNRMNNLVNTLVNKNNFSIVNMEYSKLQKDDVTMILEDEGAIDWENFVHLVKNSGNFKSITLRKNKFTFRINDSGTLYLPEWVDGFELIIEVIGSLVVKNGYE